MKPILPYYHPTDIVIIDDDQQMLQTLARRLNLQKITHTTFADPRQGLAYLNKGEYRKELVDRLTVIDEGREFPDSVSFDPLIFLKEAQQPKRHSQVSTLIIDYEMPGINGLEVCRQIENPHMKKILLTGVADETLAIEAFNRGLIHQYIRKHDDDFVKKLIQTIENAQYEYFFDLLKVPLEILHKRDISTALTDPVYIAEFRSILNQHNIVEYYTLDDIGSAIVLDEEHEVYSFVIMNDNSIEVFKASDLHESLSDEQKQWLENRENLPFGYDVLNLPHYNAKLVQESWRKPKVSPAKNTQYYTCFEKGLIQLPNDWVIL